MRKCKDCKLFKNGCGFSNVDEQLGLNGDFVACGQFVKVNDSKDCLSTFENPHSFLNNLQSLHFLIFISFLP